MAHTRVTNKDARIIAQCSSGKYMRNIEHQSFSVANDRSSNVDPGLIMADGITTETFKKGLFVAPCAGKVVGVYVNGSPYIDMAAGGTVTLNVSKAVNDSAVSLTADATATDTYVTVASPWYFRAGWTVTVTDSSNGPENVIVASTTSTRVNFTTALTLDHTVANSATITHIDSPILSSDITVGSATAPTADTALDGTLYTGASVVEFSAGDNFYITVTTSAHAIDALGYVTVCLEWVALDKSYASS
jgi:hypothetical protein